MKFRPVLSIVVVVILALASISAVKFIDRIPTRRLAQLFGITVTVSDLSNTPTPTPRVTPTGTDFTATIGSVAVQTFAGPRLVRQGPGTAVSADGLILTTVTTAPFGTGTYVYQVATPRGQLLRARRVAADQKSGLALLKTDASDLDAVLFDASAPLTAGQELDAISAAMLFSKFTSQKLPVWIVFVSENSQATLSLDRSLGLTFNGARLIDGANHSVGIMRYTTGPIFIDAQTINAFLESYLSKPVSKE